MKKIVYIILSTIILCACDREEYLDIEPKGVVIPSKVIDYRLLLDQEESDFDAISPGFLRTYSNTNLMSDDATSVGVELNFDGGVSKNMFTFADNIYEETQEDPDWQATYGQIYACNIVLEGVLDATGGTEAEKRQLYAEALVHRAFAYFVLVNLYGVHYNPATASSDPGVPFRLDTELTDVQFPRQSIQAVYDLILSDLDSAINDLPDTPVYSFRPSKAGVYAFLARIYLYMGRFDEAKTAADNSLALHNTILDYSAFPDIIFPGSGIVTLPSYLDDVQITWAKSGIQPATESFALSTDLINLISFTDQRRRLLAPFWLFGLSGAGSFYAAESFRIYRNVGFSVPEILLIRAECYAREGNAAMALADLNTLREARFTGPYTPLASTDANEVLDWVKTERRVELMGNGMRYFDLKRYNVFDTPTDLVHTLNGTTYTLPANSKNWALPIARRYILANPEIGENIRD
ncbi:RagB/SusD family nutrient uptake outer membrane protein [Flavivirga eckloniae]|uniref:RagB/SusD family nutrient uptake outer membrane protein n=1 Tax=Flavivirga eckloniae TaxID=1803846 RepID=A0A2K9PUE1_9FLAO|nr:RagB/SusD family nutrient uptake outer membrane protein [Flavivirga eckloniae]AUP80681.1 hypothetical protein C1H87_18965 [Flavivirga eckloniae]